MNSGRIRGAVVQFASFGAAVVICNIALFKYIPLLSMDGREIVNIAAPLVFVALSILSYAMLKSGGTAKKALIANAVILALMAPLLAIAESVPDARVAVASIAIGAAALSYSLGFSVMEQTIASDWFQSRAAAAGICGSMLGASMIVWGGIYDISGYGLTAAVAGAFLLTFIALGPAREMDAGANRIFRRAPVNRSARNSGARRIAATAYMALVFTAFGIGYSRTILEAEKASGRLPLYGIAAIVFSIVYAAAVRRGIRHFVAYAAPLVVTVYLIIQMATGAGFGRTLLEPGILAAMPFLMLLSCEFAGGTRSIGRQQYSYSLASAQCSAACLSRSRRQWRECSALSARCSWRRSCRASRSRNRRSSS